MKKKGILAVLMVAVFLGLMACESSPSYSSSSRQSVSYDDIYPALTRFRTNLENNNIEAAKNAIASASQRDKTAALYAISAKVIRGFNYRNNTEEMIQFLINRGVDVNDTEPGDFPTSSETGIGFSMRKGITALMDAAVSGNFEAVQTLVENGAKVNLRDPSGATALSKSYDKGEIEIYNYLIEHGAIEFAPRQVAQQPAAQTPQGSSTTVIVQPSAPTQTAPSQQTPAAPTLRTGTYAASGTNMTMSLNLGQVTAFIGHDPIAFGTYRVSGNQVVITFDSRGGTGGPGDVLKGNTYAYNITSDATFSGNGESWARTGY